MTIWVTVIDSRTLRRIRSRVFGHRQASLADEASRYTMIDYEITLTDIRRAIRERILALPESAFDGDGAGDSSAGRVVARLCDTSSGLYLRVARDILNLPAIDRLPRPQHLSQIDALAALDDIDRELLEVLGTADEADLERRINDPHLGCVQLRDVLLALALHEDAHLGYLVGSQTAHCDSDGYCAA
ncbi:MAG: DinB family protein [Thermomicrobiales bacterium]|nr:DinB family protein [Thermomicrobiales bacterium]